MAKKEIGDLGMGFFVGIDHIEPDVSFDQDEVLGNTKVTKTKEKGRGSRVLTHFKKSEKFGVWLDKCESKVIIRGTADPFTFTTSYPPPTAGGAPCNAYSESSPKAMYADFSAMFYLGSATPFTV